MLKTSSRHVLKTSLRRLEDQQMFAGYKLELLTPETMRLLGSTKKDVDADKDGEIVPKLESVEFVLVHCNLVKNDY